MAAARAPRRWATIRRRPGACRRSATAPARRASSPIVTSSVAGAAARRVAADEPFLQEGAVGRGAPDAARRVHERLQLQDDDPHLVADVDDLPRDGGSHHRRTRRAQARARVRVRGDGRPQARRVRADAHLPRPRRHREEAMSSADDKGKDQVETEVVDETTLEETPVEPEVEETEVTEPEVEEAEATEDEVEDAPVEPAAEEAAKPRRRRAAKADSPADAPNPPAA